MKKIFLFFLLFGNSIFASNDDCVEIECLVRPLERKFHQMKPLCRERDRGSFFQTNDVSSNWSGYAAFTGTADAPNPTYHSVTEVQGSWIVPSLTPQESGNTYSSAWIGIDGFNNFIVEQIGTEHDVIDQNPSYFAWFELYPAGLQLIDGFPINPGDIIEANISYQGEGKSQNSIFKLAIRNQTQKVKFEILQSTLPGYPAHLSSAEWIVEAPAATIQNSDCFAILPFADVGTLPFLSCQAVINQKKGAIDDPHWTFSNIVMSSAEGVKAIPSPLTLFECKKKRKCQYSRFSVTWTSSGSFPYQEMCP